MEVAIGFGEHALAYGWSTLFMKGIIAGWLVASMVWLIHAARDTVTRLFLVFFIMYLIPSADLFHCIVGACEVLFMFFSGYATLSAAMLGFFLPVVLGNTVGGIRTNWVVSLCAKWQLMCHWVPRRYDQT